jgi:hypothetical protein
MKKTVLTLGVIALAQLSFSQTQIGNPGLETWEVVASPDQEPVNWNSFLTASGSLSGFASNQITQSTDVRPGSTGTSSALIFSNSVLGVIANGNLTVARINMGSATPTNANNYNSSIISDVNFSEAMPDSPDSLVFWVKFTPINATDSARVSAILHDNYAYRDPIDAASIPHTVALAQKNYITTNGQWVRKSIPFVYTGPSTTPAFLLLTFTTNKTPGGGADNDQVWIDDVELIYNAATTNGPIVANDDVATTAQDTPVDINVLTNDIDPEGDIDTASMTITSAASNGMATVNTTTGVITYTPNAGYSGSDMFTYQICDGGNPTPVTCDDAMVMVTITPGTNSLTEQTADAVQVGVQNHQLSIVSSKPLSGNLSIYGANGQLVHEGDVNGAYTFKETGMYIVRIVSNLGTTSKKVINY